ncbi:MAG TPA: SRPBCC domain-containing protein [Devosiaceae bacterium]
MNEMNVDLTEPREMVLTRVFDAPRDLVWRCWTDPRMFAQWWGPEGFTNRCEFDLRPGGRQSIVMIAPDGTEIPVGARYVEIVEGERIVGRLEGDSHPQGEVVSSITMVVTFKDTAGGGTVLTVRQIFDTPAFRDANMKMGAEAGWRQSFVKLDRLLTEIGMSM